MVEILTSLDRQESITFAQTRQQKIFPAALRT
jgi:hypothetical protein